MIRVVPTRPLPLAGVFRDLLLRRVFVAALVAQLLDALSTAAGLSVGLDERNPFTVSVLRAYGVSGLLLQKVLVVGLLLAAMAKLPRRAAVVAVGATTAVTAFAVCANHTAVVAITGLR
jgi:hypothetical protein